MTNTTTGDAAIAVVRRNTEQVQGTGDWALYDELFDDAFIDHTPQPGAAADKAGSSASTRRSHRVLGLHPRDPLTSRSR